MLGGKTRKQNHCNLTIKIKLLKLEKRRNIKVQSAIDKIEAATHLKTTAKEKARQHEKYITLPLPTGSPKMGERKRGGGLGSRKRKGELPSLYLLPSTNSPSSPVCPTLELLAAASTFYGAINTTLCLWSLDSTDAGTPIPTIFKFWYSGY